MVETAVVMPVIIGIWMATVFAHRVVTARLETLSTARGKGWNYAAGNCGDTGDAGPSAVSTREGQLGRGGGVPRALVHSLASQAGITNGAVLTLIDMAADTAFALVFRPFPASKASRDKTAQVTSRGGGSTNFSAKLSSTSTVMCNEAPHDGNIEGFFKALFKLVPFS